MIIYRCFVCNKDFIYEIKSLYMIYREEPFDIGYICTKCNKNNKGIIPQCINCEQQCRTYRRLYTYDREKDISEEKGCLCAKCDPTEPKRILERHRNYVKTEHGRQKNNECSLNYYYRKKGYREIKK
jgi:hypothetical protein